MTDLAASLDGIEAVVFDLDGTLVDTLPDALARLASRGAISCQTGS